MLEITSIAATKIQEHLEANNITSAVRVATANGCGGPRLNLFLDEKKDSDTSVEPASGVQMIIDKELLESCGAVKVDYVTGSGCGCQSGGFAVTSMNPLPGAGEGGGCGGSCSSGSCGC